MYRSRSKNSEKNQKERVQECTVEIACSRKEMWLNDQLAENRLLFHVILKYVLI